MRKSFHVFLTLALLLGALAPGAFAQSQATTGVIEGTVVDESGAPVPGVNVTIRNTGTNFERVVATDADGRFRGLLLPLGPYRVVASLTGFATVIREGIDLAVGQAVNLRLSLKVSAVQEEVVVTGELPVVDTSRAEGSTLIDQRSIKGLPNNGRNFLDFTKLTPGVAIVQGPDGDELSINGQKGIANNISVDGADFNNPFFGEQRGGQRPAFTFNLDAVKELVVVAEGANAEFGRSNGGFVTVVTKSGTNETHGTAHVFFKNDSLSSAPKNADGTKGNKFDSNQLQSGFTLGGPLQKDKAFYFLALDYQNASNTKQTDPTRIEQRLVDFFANLGSPNENGPIERTNADPALQLHLVRAEERHLRRRLMGRECQRHREGLLARGHRFGHLEPVGDHPQRVPFPVGERVAAAALRGTVHHRPEPAAARHGFRFRPLLPLRRTVLHPG
jgi:hypothetical protein